LKFLGVTILQGVEFPILLLIFAWALQQCSATALPVIRSIFNDVAHSYYSVIGDKPYGASQNSTLHNFVLPGPIFTKLGMVDYVGDPYSEANFS